MEPNWNDPEMADAILYCDGSLLHGRLPAFRTTGFGIAVVAVNGRLIGFGSGRPPARCSTAASAEAYALFTVLTENAFTPHIRTDCLSLLLVASSGTLHASDAKKVLARIWRDIADILGEDTAVLVDSGRLVWLPAHTSRSSIGNVKLSNG